MPDAIHRENEKEYIPLLKPEVGKQEQDRSKKHRKHGYWPIDRELDKWQTVVRQERQG
jgi:hypothetical protein